MREEGGQCDSCGYYLKNIVKFLISHIGLVSLVIGYTIVGAFTFERLEAEHELQIKKNMSSVRLKVTDDLWVITDDMKVLNESMWAASVRERLKLFERSLISAIKNDGWDGSEDLNTQQWTFAGALFYSIILITTIGE
ncbi:uncoordinated protein 58 [Penaeus vannamei]|uniref:uncoordinated protein 58 n=1 Tax=Penaeus vannamei TaxID=6689 RepID=UPI00387F7151